MFLSLGGASPRQRANGRGIQSVDCIFASLTKNDLEPLFLRTKGKSTGLAVGRSEVQLRALPQWPAGDSHHSVSGQVPWWGWGSHPAYLIEVLVMPPVF